MSKFSCFLFGNPTNKTVTGTANTWELLIANHLDQSLWSTNQKYWAAVRSNLVHSFLEVHNNCVAAFTSHGKVHEFGTEKLISWAKPAHFDFLAINFTFWSHILSTGGHALTSHRKTVQLRWAKTIVLTVDFCMTKFYGANSSLLIQKHKWNSKNLKWNQPKMFCCWQSTVNLVSWVHMQVHLHFWPLCKRERERERKPQFFVGAMVNQHPPAHHPLNACYYSVVDEPQLS